MGQQSCLATNMHYPSGKGKNDPEDKTDICRGVTVTWPGEGTVPPQLLRVGPAAVATPRATGVRPPPCWTGG